jgi:hypothetical protein
MTQTIHTVKFSLCTDTTEELAKYTRIDVSTALTMKNAVFWGLKKCDCYINRRFGGTYRPSIFARSSDASYIVYCY